MAKKTENKSESNSQENVIAEIDTPEVNELLDNCKNKFKHVFVIGTNDDGILHFTTNRPTYQHMHYILNRSIFELNLHEKNNIGNKT